VLASKLIIEVDIAGRDDELPAVWHCVAGINYQIHQHLTNISRVGSDLSNVRRKGYRQSYLLIKETPQHFFRAGDHFIKVERDEDYSLLPAEEHELARQPDGALRRELDLLRVLTQGTVMRKIRKKHFGVAHNDGNDVVEIMRNTARKLIAGGYTQAARGRPNVQTTHIGMSSDSFGLLGARLRRRKDHS